MACTCEDCAYSRTIKVNGTILTALHCRIHNRTVWPTQRCGTWASLKLIDNEV